MLKQFLLVSLLVLLSFSAIGQDRTADFVFRFKLNNDILYIPWEGNENAMEELLSAIEKNRAAIEAGNMFLLVSSYATSTEISVPETSAIASIRRKRTKTEIIKKSALKDMNFVTDLTFSEPYEDEKDVVVITLPAPIEKVARLAGLDAAERVIIYNQKQKESSNKGVSDSKNTKTSEDNAKVRAEVESILNIKTNKTDSLNNTTTDSTKTAK